MLTWSNDVTECFYCVSKSVAVCVKKGNAQLAKETLKWLEKETEIPEVCIYLLQF